MFIPIDPYTTELPSDLQSNDSIFETVDASVATPLMLDRWEVKAHTYGKQVAVKIGFLANLFSGSTKHVSAGVIHEAKRFRVRQLGGGRLVEEGVAVRLSVATSEMHAGFDLTIPNLAAQAQLGMSDARIGITVVGFAGPIGDLLPTPADLDVKNFSKFWESAEIIQKRVFGPDGLPFLAPTTLAYSNSQTN